MTRDPKLQLFETGSEAYRAAFERSLSLGSGGASLAERLDVFTRDLPRRVAVDWGAGGGRATALLCQRFERVYAVEPSATMRAAIAQRAPAAEQIEGDLERAEIPEAVDFGLINHVLYHVPEADWTRLVLRCAAQLSDEGRLCIALKHPSAGCGALMEHFGAPRFDLYTLLDGLREQHAFSIEFSTSPGRLETRSFEETLMLARFVLSDRPAHEFRRLGSERELEAYVREHYWDASRQRGGWDNPKVYATLRRNPLR